MFKEFRCEFSWTQELRRASSFEMWCPELTSEAEKLIPPSFRINVSLTLPLPVHNEGWWTLLSLI